MKPAESDLVQVVAALGADSYEARQRAYRTLLERGGVAPDRVLAALPPRSADPEVRFRVEELRRRVPWQFCRVRAERLAGTDADMHAALEYLFHALYDGEGFLTENDFDPFAHRRPWSAERATLIAHAGFLEHREPVVRMDALAALEHLRETSVSPQVVPLLTDSDTAPWWQAYGGETAVCSVAARALEALGDASLLPRIEPLLTHEESAVRRAAVEALGGIASPLASSAVAACLEDEDAGVRAAAVRAFARLRADPAPHLRPMLDDQDTQVRRAVIYALGSLRQKRYAADLVPCIADPELDVRRAAVSALGQIGDLGVADRVVPYLQDERAEVRRAALLCLGSIRAEQRMDEVALQLEALEPEVREAAATALEWLSGESWEADDDAGRVSEARAWWEGQLGTRNLALETPHDVGR